MKQYDKTAYFVILGIIFFGASVVAYKIRDSINWFGPVWFYFLFFAIVCVVLLFVKK